ncbi:glucosyl-dolichyl phosphate glucuronosyltransferase [Halobaculum halobium]|uniref:Glucosyl-dolichyl phosphate glucuronosyltransferase n=1 Tax=Halobaculum halobium TaxID=3032281 RepID=A0ABD5TEQ7_9EURY|nr:glucosyl-dolichyl phosphate glucuronosyltransferase [Halobaculum sp. SYNS20]
MQVSVVLCTYTESMFVDFCEAADSILNQSYEEVQLVIVVDGNHNLYDRVIEEYGDRSDVVTHCNDWNVGLLESRNTGAELADGDVVAFIDDDAVADKHWVEELVGSYEAQDAVAVGGKMTADWVAGRPSYLPEEFFWLVGVTHRGFADGPGPVRNTFGSNISFDREVFLHLGGFDAEVGGRKGDKNLQGGETELCARLRKEYGMSVWYNPNATVAHKVYEYRTDIIWLLDRAFWQGYSKRGMQQLVPDSGGEEGEFLGDLLREYTPERLYRLFRDPSSPKVQKLVLLLVLTGAVGCGYVYGIAKWG